MKPTLTIQELFITIVAKKQNPTLLKPDFLKESKIIPINWKLARTPILKSQVAIISFSNGVNFLSRPGMLTLSESIGKEKETMKIPDLAKKYVTTLPNLDYQAVEINPRSFATFPESKFDAAHQFIANLFVTASWQNAGTTPMKASFNIAYTFDNCQMNFTLAEAELRLTEKPSQAAILFVGNISHKLSNDEKYAPKQKLEEFIDNWEHDWDIFLEIINKFFK